MYWLSLNILIGVPAHMSTSPIFTDSSNNMSFPVKSVTLHLEFVERCVCACVCVLEKHILYRLKAFPIFSFQWDGQN